MKIEVTKRQLKAIINNAETLSAMVGSAGGDSTFDEDVSRDVRHVKRFLDKNNINYHFNLIKND